MAGRSSRLVTQPGGVSAGQAGDCRSCSAHLRDARIHLDHPDDSTRSYVWVLGLAYAVSGSSLEVYHADRLGSLRAITDASGTVTAT